MFIFFLKGRNLRFQVSKSSDQWSWLPPPNETEQPELGCMQRMLKMRMISFWTSTRRDEYNICSIWYQLICCDLYWLHPWLLLPLLNSTGERDILLLSAYSLVQAGVEYVDEHGEQRMALPKERLEHLDAALWANFRLTLPMCRALFDEVVVLHLPLT